MGLSNDLVVDIADEINFELNSPSDISISFISFWLRRNVGKLNNLISTTFTITADSPFNFSSALSEEQKDNPSGRIWILEFLAPSYSCRDNKRYL